MIITRTPVRVSFLGGGTDYPDYFRRYGGQTLGVSIDKYSYVTVNRLASLFDYSIRVGYSKTELVNSVDEILHPSVRECLRFLDLAGNIEINYVGDLPARTGLGSSSSFTVGLLHALHAFKGEFVSKTKLATEAVYVEQEKVKERVGVQDQYTCAIGGLVNLQFGQDGAIRVLPIPMPAKRLAEFNQHLMLFYTGIRRHAHEVLEEQIENTQKDIISSELSYLNDLVGQGMDILTNCHPITLFGELLNNAWETKRRLSSKISSPIIDQWYDHARRSGAIGGKLLGAGGGGFLLLLVKPESQTQVRNALRELPLIRFAFEYSGSSIIFYLH